MSLRLSAVAVPRPLWYLLHRTSSSPLSCNLQECFNSHRNFSGAGSLQEKSPMAHSAFESPPRATDYATWSQDDLISRISMLELQLRAQTQQLSAQLNSSADAKLTTNSEKKPRRANVFDPSRHSTRHIALKFAYLGARFNGLEHSNGNLTPLPTVEEVLWKALRKSRLISPELPDGSDESMDVVWGEGRRKKMYTTGRAGEGKVRLELEWGGCQYSKCGRTDRGVSAFGQVVGVMVRSARPLKKRNTFNGVNGHDESSRVNSDSGSGVLDIDTDGLAAVAPQAFDSVTGELPYISILNSILPPEIRILAWCPNPPADFDARFSCRERRYKYFFTNPAFCPTPGPLGQTLADGSASTVREGWLDIDKMQAAAKKLVGLHDFRNFCKVDPSKQMTAFDRRITFAGIELIEQKGGPVGFHLDFDLNDSRLAATYGLQGGGSQPKVYAFVVHGTAFLWHQVRCMVAILFLVGQGLELPSIVDELLDVGTNPCKPTYEMASDAPLVLWDCIFPDDNSAGADSLQWVYAGDATTLPSVTTKGDGKYGLGGTVDECWSIWRKCKMDELLSSSLLDLAISQGDGSSLSRGGLRVTDGRSRSQRVFDGRETPRMAGEYVPVMQKPRMESVEMQNSKYRATTGARREARKPAVLTDAGV